MIFKRKRYKLPNFPPSLKQDFRGMCEVLPEKDVPIFKQEVDATLAHFEDRRLKNPKINIILAREMAKRCHLLLDQYSELSDKFKALAIGAIRYFVVEDTVSEESFATGFDDDAKVMNYVLEELGYSDGFIEL